MKLQKGQKVRLKPLPELIEVFEHRGFFNGSYRHSIASQIAGVVGTVDDIEEKYEYDYFYFKDQNGCRFSIPYQSVDFSDAKTIRTESEIRARIEELNNEIEPLIYKDIPEIDPHGINSRLDKITALKWVLGEDTK